MEKFAVRCLSSEIISTKHDCTVSRSSRLALFSQLNSFNFSVFPIQRLTKLPVWAEVYLHPLLWSSPLVPMPCVSCWLTLGLQRCADSRKHQLQRLSLNLGLNAFEGQFLRKHQVFSGIKLQHISKELSSVLARREDGNFWDMLKRKPEGQFSCPNIGIQASSRPQEIPPGLQPLLLRGLGMLDLCHPWVDVSHAPGY